MSDPIDPYRAPQSASIDAAPAVDPASLPTAGKGRRFGTFVIDYIGQVALMMVLMIAVVIVAGEAVLARIEGMNRLEEVLVGLACLVLYYLLFEGLWGRTPGKWIFGTRVVDEHGRRPAFKQVLGRTFARLVPFEAFSLLFSAENRGWHDTWPRTRVVRTR